MSSLPISTSLTLPQCLAFRSKHSGNYIRYDSTTGKLVEQSGDDTGVVSPWVRFRIEPSKEHDGLVHVRCCYNNKYWVAQEQGGGGWIIGTTNEPEEDLSKPLCTLFKPITVADGSIRLLHAQLAKYASPLSGFDKSKRVRTEEPYYLIHPEREDHHEAAHTVLEYAAHDVVLPEQVVFKGDNDKYLSARLVNGEEWNYLQFASDDITDPTLINTTWTRQDGSVRIKSNHFGKWWRRDKTWIFADSNDEESFGVTKVDDNHIVLRHIGSNEFCTRLNRDQKDSCLAAITPSINRWALLRVAEPVISREIYDVEYHLSEARIYDKKIIREPVKVSTVNITSSAMTATLTQSYTRKTTSRWDATVELKLGVTASFKAGIPFFVDESIEISAEFSGSYSWGETIENESKQEMVFQVAVAPGKKVAASLVAMQVSCDVPYSYKQKDVRTDGEVVVRTKHDGLYTGVNSFDVHYEAKEVDI